MTPHLNCLTKAVHQGSSEEGVTHVFYAALIEIIPNSNVNVFSNEQNFVINYVANAPNAYFMP